jgi:hypothetical protein
MDDTTFEYVTPPYVYNGVTGLVKRRLLSPERGYRWVLRHACDVQYVKIQQQSDGSAVVDVYVDDYTNLAETLPSYKAACKRYRRLAARYGFRTNLPAEREPDAFVFALKGGRTLYGITNPYRWVLRHMDHIYRVEVSALPAGRACVTVYIDNGTAMRHVWPSCAAANRRFIRLSAIHGFDHKFYNSTAMSSATAW